MASNGVHTVPEVIVIDQSVQGIQEKKIFVSNTPSQLIVHTGNIANWNSLKSRKTQLPVNEVCILKKVTVFKKF